MSTLKKSVAATATGSVVLTAVKEQIQQQASRSDSPDHTIAIVNALKGEYFVYFK